MDLTETFKTGGIVYQGKLLEVHRDVVALSGGREEIREVIRHPGAAVVVPYLGRHQFLLVQQVRYALNRITLEFPAGRLDPGETPLDCACRELAEETGYTARSWQPLFSMYPAPGYTDERLDIFLAADLQAGVSHPDEDEQVILETATFAQLLTLFQKGQLDDAKTVAALLFLKGFPEIWGG